MFASKRGDGVHGRLFLSRLDAAGRASTPLLLPQRDPAANDRFPASYNVPELTIELVPTNAGALGRLTREPLPADAAAQHQPEGAPSQMK